jgi:hypothetical protein
MPLLAVVPSSTVKNRMPPVALVASTATDSAAAPSTAVLMTEPGMVSVAHWWLRTLPTSMCALPFPKKISWSSVKINRFVLGTTATSPGPCSVPPPVIVEWPSMTSVGVTAAAMFADGVNE